MILITQRAGNQHYIYLSPWQTDIVMNSKKCNNPIWCTNTLCGLSVFIIFKKLWKNCLNKWHHITRSGSLITFYEKCVNHYYISVPLQYISNISKIWIDKNFFSLQKEEVYFWIALLRYINIYNKFHFSSK